jgi:hypothetical protein
VVNGIGVGKGVADVAQAGRAKKGIGDGVQNDIGVAMANQAARMRDVHTA